LRAVRRGSIVQLVLIGVVAGAIATATAVLIPWMPVQASKEAHRIDFVYWFATVISLFVFAIVAAVLIYSLINFRVKPGDMSDGPPIHGHTALEIMWTIVPTILVTSITIVSAIVLSQDGHAGPNPLKIDVVGEQFAWTFKYPNGQTYPDLHLPIDRGVILRITSRDVLHSFWVPQFGQKQDAVPGAFNNLVITPNRVGTYPVVCTELCGLGHSLMRSEAVVMSEANWAKWYKGGTAATGGGAAGGGAGAGGADPAVATFNTSGCVACHTFTAIPGAVGKVGPSLDTLSESAKAAGEPLEAFVKESIVDPNAYVPPGYTKGTMPPNFATTIPADKLDQLVQYLVAHTK
jgi:cytochrome c oxidase subunit II